MKLLRKFLGLFRRRKLEAEMGEEMRAHLELQVEANLARGMSAEEARFAARRDFGGVEQIKEAARDQRGWRALEEFSQDLRYAARALRKHPSFTITAVLTLAFGIGVNAALFTVYNLVALRSLPLKDPDALVKIAGQKQGGFYPNFSYAEFLEYRNGNHGLTGLAAFNEVNLQLRHDDVVVRDSLFEGRSRDTVVAQFVLDNYFSVLGGEMTLGRGFLPEENGTPGAAPVVVLSHLFWQRHFNSNPNVIGRTLTLRNQALTVIGVTAPEFVGQQPAPPAVWLPLMMWGPPAAYGPTGPAAFRLIGRLQLGVTEAQVKADLDVIAARLARELPGPDAKDSVRLERGMRFIDIKVNAKTLAASAPLLLGFVMVLVIACTNVANLLLARGVTRQHEVGVRLTLGAGRARVIRQLLTENFLLCVIGGAAGLGLAVWTLQILQPIILGRLPPEWATETRRWSFLEVTPDWRVFGFTALLTIVAVVAAGLLPALHTSSAGLISALKNDGTVFGRRVSQSRLRSFLVVVQVAVCLMLLSCAGLLARDLFELKNAKVGFDPRAVFQVYPQSVASTTERRAAMLAAAEILNSTPGVTGASVAFNAPLVSVGAGNTLVGLAGLAGSGLKVDKMKSYMVAAEFFWTLGIPVTRGRGFLPVEIGTSARVVLVSETTAKRLWPQENPVGKTVSVDRSALIRSNEAKERTWTECEVIGVVGDVMSDGFHRDYAAIYVPLSAEATATSLLFVRTTSDSPTVLAEIARQVETAGVKLQLGRPLSSFLEEQILPFYGAAVLSGALGGLALLMASVGLYGVMAFGVNQRAREIGIRVALGATVGNVVRLFVQQGMKLVAIGAVFGLGAGAMFALLLKKVLASLPSTFDPLAFGGVAAIFGAVAFAACWLPARRAAKVDAIVALRCE